MEVYLQRDGISDAATVNGDGTGVDDGRDWFRELVAVTTGLLWAKVIGFLYTVNLEVKGFLCTLGQVRIESSIIILRSFHTKWEI